jgi:hypothetical protein
MIPGAMLDWFRVWLRGLVPLESVSYAVGLANPCCALSSAAKEGLYHAPFFLEHWGGCLKFDGGPLRLLCKGFPSLAPPFASTSFCVIRTIGYHCAAFQSGRSLEGCRSVQQRINRRVIHNRPLSIRSTDISHDSCNQRIPTRTQKCIPLKNHIAVHKTIELRSLNPDPSPPPPDLAPRSPPQEIEVPQRHYRRDPHEDDVGHHDGERVGHKGGVDAKGPRQKLGDRGGVALIVCGGGGEGRGGVSVGGCRGGS